jgi:formylglycine-generating enzyme required for sulfatase activity
MIIKILKSVVSILFISCVTVIYAQNTETILMEKVSDHLANGNCDKAQTAYDTWKAYSGKTNANLEKLIRECSSEKKNTDTLTNSEIAKNLNFEMVFVEGGSFYGCIPENDCDCQKATSGNVTTSKISVDDFYIGKYEVTQAQWKQVMGTSIRQKRDDVKKHVSTIREVGSNEFSIVGEGDNYPMYLVSREDAEEFIARLNTLTDKKYRLPKAAEWEYAELGGNKSQGYKYSGSNNLFSVAWFRENSDGKTHSVGTKLPNELGIYDMTGNVMEWTTTYPFGNSYVNSIEDCLLQNCWRLSKNSCVEVVGFRLALDFTLVRAPDVKIRTIKTQYYGK